MHGSVPAAPFDGEEITRNLLERAVAADVRCAWPRGARHEYAMRLALESAIGLCISRAARAEPGWGAALREVIEEADVTPLQALLTAAGDQLAQGGSPMTVAVMHLRIAAVALVHSDIQAADDHFVAAIALDPDDPVGQRGLKHLRAFRRFLYG